IASGGQINMTRNIPLAVPLDFTSALNGDVGPFLTPVGFTSRAGGTFISDNVTLVNVQGSPRSTNFLRITGPGIAAAYPAFQSGGDSVMLDVFTLQGVIAPAGVAISKAYVTKGAAETAVDVWATSETGQQIQASAGLSLPAAMVESGTSGSYFGRVLLGPGASPTTVSVSNITDFPPTTATQALTDIVSINSAIFTPGRALATIAASSNKVGNPALTVTGIGFSPVVLTSTTGGQAMGPCGLPAGVPPPASIIVTSADGGSASAAV